MAVINTNVSSLRSQNAGRLADKMQATAMERLSSGKQISRPSDSPGGTVSSMELRSSLAQQQQYKRNADDGITWLNIADSALQGVDEKVSRARSLVLQGMSAASGSGRA